MPSWALARTTAEDLHGHATLCYPFTAILKRVQHELFNLGSILATLPEDVHPRQPRITAAEVEQLEHEIDASQWRTRPLRSFVLPGGSRLDAELHVCRTVCRRAERLLVRLAREQSVPAEGVQLSEPPERCPVCLEPLGESRAGRRRNALGAERTASGSTA